MKHHHTQIMSLLLFGTLLQAEDPRHFHDAFERSDSNSLGNAWVEVEAAADDLYLAQFQAVLTNPAFDLEGRMTQHLETQIDDQLLVQTRLEIAATDLDSYLSLEVGENFNAQNLSPNEGYTNFVALEVNVIGELVFRFFKDGQLIEKTTNLLQREWDLNQRAYLELKAVEQGYEGRVWLSDTVRPDYPTIDLKTPSHIQAQQVALTTDDRNDFSQHTAVETFVDFVKVMEQSDPQIRHDLFFNDDFNRNDNFQLNQDWSESELNPEDAKIENQKLSLSQAQNAETRISQTLADHLTKNICAWRLDSQIQANENIEIFKIGVSQEEDGTGNGAFLVITTDKDLAGEGQDGDLFCFLTFKLDDLEIRSQVWIEHDPPNNFFNQDFQFEIVREGLFLFARWWPFGTERPSNPMLELYTGLNLDFQHLILSLQGQQQNSAEITADDLMFYYNPSAPPEVDVVTYPTTIYFRFHDPDGLVDLDMLSLSFKIDGFELGPSLLECLESGACHHIIFDDDPYDGINEETHLSVWFDIGDFTGHLVEVSICDWADQCAFDDNQ